MNFGFHAIIKSEAGKVRMENEDAVLWFEPRTEISKQKDGYLAVIADGMGGLQEGKMASSICINTIKSTYYNSTETDIIKRLNSAVHCANSEILNFALSKNISGRMGSTCTAVVFHTNSFHYTQIGDSRLYFAMGNSLEKITCDQTIAEQLYSSGIIEQEEIHSHPQRHILTQAIGISENIKPVSNSRKFNHAERIKFFLCSDGVSNEISHEDLADILLSDLSINEMSAKLNNKLLKSSARDNYSYIIITPKT